MKSNLIDNRQIRVFISSTFQDMQDERDYLMKRTFPKLRKLAAERDVTLTELDLRWGITEEESESGKVVEICLREIENCIPFFIGIIGNRYGWVPNEKDLADNVTERFPDVKTWIDEHLSVTEMEMQFGVLSRKEDLHAYFYIKKKEKNDEEDNHEMLTRLKREVRQSKYPVSTYNSIEDLASQVEKAFISLLDRLYPNGNLSEHEKNKIVQKSFIHALSSTYVKDINSFRVLNEFVENDFAQFLVVTGESGMGKSALLANWTKEHSDSNVFSIIPYFSSNGGNQNHSHIQKYITTEMRERYGLEHTSGTDKDQLEKTFDLFATRQDKLVIVLDAVNQIADVDQAKQLNWLPIPPKNIKLIFSTLENDVTMDIFKSKNYPIFHLYALDDEKRKTLISCYLLNNYGTQEFLLQYQ